MNAVGGKLPYNLPLLQNVIKRDPESYKEEFLEQYEHYKATMKVFLLKPDTDCTDLTELVSFISQVAQCYKSHVKEFPEELVTLLQRQGTLLLPDFRMNVCKALILLRNKGLISELTVLRVAFDLVKCKDKELRKFLFSSVMARIKSLAFKRRNVPLVSSMQHYVFSKVNDANVGVARIALLILIGLYRKHVWHDAKTANIIANCCFSRIAKVMVTALKFFSDHVNDDDSDESDDDEQGNTESTRTLKDVMMAFRVAKKSKKRKKQMERAKAALTKEKRSKKPAAKGTFHLSAIQMLYDPQDFAEKLFKRLETSNDRFEIKMLKIGLISKLIGMQKLFLLNFYPFLQRYLQPHQREVTRVLLFAAQASHDLVPPDVIESVVRTLVNNFVTERNSVEVMTVGINAVREICHGCPLAMGEDLLQDLTAYKTYKNKNVTMAARSLIQLFRTVNPALLHRKDRGKPTEFSKELKVKAYGEVIADTHIPGSECLPLEAAASATASDNKANSSATESRRRRQSSASSSCSDEDSWVEVNEEEESESDDVVAGADEDVTLLPTEPEAESISQSTAADGKAAADAVCSGRILTQAEFKRIQAIQVAKRFHSLRGGTSAHKRRRRNASGGEEPVEMAEDAEEEEERGPLPRLSDIEKLYKRPKQTKSQRLASIEAGRVGREPYGKPKRKEHVGKTNKAGRKKKAFDMIKHKTEKKHRKRSFRDKQIALKNHLLALKKWK